MRRPAPLIRRAPLAGRNLGPVSYTHLVCFELHIPVGNNANQLSIVTDGHTGDAVLGHQLIRLSQCMAGPQPEGVCDNAVLTALDHVYLFRLLADGHILVDDADAALAGDGDGHPVLSHGVHGGADEGDIQMDLPGQTGTQVDVRGE